MGNKLKAYITCPVSHSQKRLKLLKEIDEIVKENRFETFVFRFGGTSKEIFKRDYKELQKANLLIAEVSERSHAWCWY